MADYVHEAVSGSLRNNLRLEKKLEESAAASSPNVEQKLDKVRQTSKKRKHTSSNWKLLQKKLPKTALRNTKREKHLDNVESKTTDSMADCVQHSSFMTGDVVKTDELTDIVALDCEMVGIGPGGRQNALARVSVVNFAGNVLYDTFVKVKELVTDYRTKWSGVTPKDVCFNSPEAVEPHEAQKAVREMIRDRVLVGHALKNDLKALGLSHPRQNVRDTSIFFKKLWRAQGRRLSAGPKLSIIVAEVLGVDKFQQGQHDSCEDARAALALYKRYQKAWETSLKKEKYGTAVLDSFLLAQTPSNAFSTGKQLV